MSRGCCALSSPDDDAMASECFVSGQSGRTCAKIELWPEPFLFQPLCLFSWCKNIPYHQPNSTNWPCLQSALSQQQPSLPLPLTILVMVIPYSVAFFSAGVLNVDVDDERKLSHGQELALETGYFRENTIISSFTINMLQRAECIVDSTRLWWIRSNGNCHLKCCIKYNVFQDLFRQLNRN